MVVEIRSLFFRSPDKKMIISVTCYKEIISYNIFGKMIMIDNILLVLVKLSNGFFLVKFLKYHDF